MPNNDGHTLYLPYVVNPRVAIVGNGSFEDGRVEWSEYSTHGTMLIRSESDLAVAPYAGQWAARLGAADDETSMISQGVDVPTQRSCLTYRQWVVSNDSCGSTDYGGVGVNGVWFSTYNLCAGTATAGWVERRVDLADAITPTPTIVLNFAVVNDYSSASTLYIDSIVLDSTGLCNEQSDAETGRGQMLSQLRGTPIR